MKSKVSATQVLLLLASAAVLLAGCGQNKTIVGRWQYSILAHSGNATTTVEFTPDGKELITGQSTIRGKTATDSASGTYTVSGTTLTQNLMALTRDGQSTPLPPNLIRTGPFTLKGNHLTLIDPSSSGTPRKLTLVKE